MHKRLLAKIISLSLFFSQLGHAREATDVTKMMDAKLAGIRSVKALFEELKPSVSEAAYKDSREAFKKRGIADNMSVRIRQIGKANDYSVTVGGDTATLSVVDAQKGDFKVNGVEFSLAKAKLYSEVIDEVEAKLQKRKSAALDGSLAPLFLPGAEAVQYIMAIGVAVIAGAVYVMHVRKSEAGSQIIKQFNQSGRVRSSAGGVAPTLKSLNCEANAMRAVYYEPKEQVIRFLNYEPKVAKQSGVPAAIAVYEHPLDPDEFPPNDEKLRELYDNSKQVGDHVYLRVQEVNIEDPKNPKLETTSNSPAKILDGTAEKLFFCCKLDGCAAGASELAAKAAKESMASGSASSGSNSSGSNSGAKSEAVK